VTYTFANRIGSLAPSAIREILKVTQDPSVISFAAGNPAAFAFPVAEIEELSAELLASSGAEALQYGVSEGYGPLREQTKARIKRKFGLGNENDQLIITSGGQQVLELSAKVLGNEGDVVICETPSFVGALNAFRSYGLQLAGVPVLEDGMDLEAVEKILASGRRVAFIYTIPTYQNPTGRTMSLAKRQRLLELAEKYNVLILEDSPYLELSYEEAPPPPIKALDRSGRVIYAGSYSKVFSPGIRVGFALAPALVISKLIVAKQVSDVHTNLFFSMLLSKYLEKYDLDKHISFVCREYRKKRDVMLAAAERHLSGVTMTRPGGGLFLWGELPSGYDGFELCKLASEKKVAAVPGSAFLPDETQTSGGFRLNFSLPTEEQIEKGMALLGQAVADLLKGR
jgi:2-aminoadipate transaminase